MFYILSFMGFEDMEEKAMAVLNCKSCQKQFKVRKPDKAGIYPVKCPHCQVQSFLNFKENIKIQPQAIPKIEKRKQDNNEIRETVFTPVNIKKKTNGKLVWGRFIFRKQYVLHEGVNTIGRKDDVDKVDLSIKDVYISRHSVEIDVRYSMEEGTTYKFIVKKTKNPVLVNGIKINQGEALFLSFGDEIKLGNTTLTFKESGKKS